MLRGGADPNVAGGKSRRTVVGGCVSWQSYKITDGLLGLCVRTWQNVIDVRE